MSTDKEIKNGNDDAVDYEYGDAAPSGKSSSFKIRLSKLPHTIRDSAMRLDSDGDGVLDTSELVAAIQNLESKRRENKIMGKIIGVFVIVTVLLVAAMFGASITAARLSKELVVDPTTGFAFAANGAGVMKTADALEVGKGMPAEMTIEELRLIKNLKLNENNFQMQVFGFARNPEEDTVTFSVQSGTITFSMDGLIDATGDAEILLESAGIIHNVAGERVLGESCSGDVGTDKASTNAADAAAAAAAAAAAFSF